MLKTCSKCKEEKTLEEFHRDSTSEDGKGYYCKPCAIAKATAWGKAHLEKYFQPGMKFDNYGEWHIEHTIPVSVFNFDSPDQIDFKRCWNLENLRPMWAKENLSKGAKLKSHFQPMLRLVVG